MRQIKRFQKSLVVLQFFMTHIFQKYPFVIQDCYFKLFCGCSIVYVVYVVNVVHIKRILFLENERACVLSYYTAVQFKTNCHGNIATNYCLARNLSRPLYMSIFLLVTIQQKPNNIRMAHDCSNYFKHIFFGKSCRYTGNRNIQD